MSNQRDRSCGKCSVLAGIVALCFITRGAALRLDASPRSGQALRLDASPRSGQAQSEKLQGVTYRAPGGTTLRLMLDESNVGAEVTLGEMVFPPNSDSGDHKHGAIEMFYVVSGELEHVVNGKSQILKPGMSGFVKPPDSVRHKIDFIRAIVDEDLATGKHHGRVATRFPPGAERLPAHRPREIDLPELRGRRGVRRHLQPALRRHESGEGRRRVRRRDQGGRRVARLPLERGALLRVGLFRAALRVRRDADRRQARRMSTA